MLLEHLAEGFAEDAHTAAMHDPNAWQTREEGPIDKLFDFARSLIHGLADHVNFRGHIRALALELHRDASRSGGLYRRL